MSTTAPDLETLAPQTVDAESRSEGKRLSLSRQQILILVGTIVFAVSHFFLWWELRLNAPQFPKGLFIQATSYEIQDSPKTSFNDIDQVDGLNHYIGMMSLGDAAQFEMSIAIPAIILFVILGIVAVVWKSRWSAILTLPIVIFPFVYLADLTYWLWYAGHHLDPMAAITIDAFTPRVLGTGHIAQFSTTASFQPGWYIALAASVICLVAIVMSLKRKPDA
ncbi:MAG: cytochrome C [Thermomicrobiales bacterium]|nr:cytochrome C [Thermomicrobiales bacterium]MCO5218461.1 cytochrome C [Thermomicrobiales bacterium]MCO5223735.1 cytochrome C [Thermomicrobiales bacterium]MCO5228567.1 cytochrome C [Thermomicrobiales bacterium]